MPKVIYNGNNSTGGSVPVDPNNYTPGSTVTVLGNSGGLTLTGEVFLYWNTAANGSGTIFTPNATLTFPNQPGNLTLYAVWGVTTGLTNGGVTTHFNFFYDPALAGPGGVEPARINSLLANSGSGNAVCEDDFNWMQTQFAGVNFNNARPFPIPVYVTAIVENGYSASWWPVVLVPGNNPASLLRTLIVAELVETFMAAQQKGWGYSAGVGNEESCGEALSLFLAVQFQISQSLGTTWLMNGTPSTWLNTSLPASNPSSTEFDSTGQWGPSGTHYGARADYVNSTEPWAGNGPATGCGVAFLYYLFHQLGFSSIPQIIAAAPGLDSSNNVIGGSCLRGVYQNLTGDTSDPFPYFANLLAAAYPTNQVASIPGPNVDDPWPLGALSFVGAKNTWGKDEINDIIGKGGTYPDGFYLALDGFSLNVLGGTRPSIPTIAFGGATTALSATPPAIYHQSSNPKVPQQILFAYDVNFATPLGTFPASGETPAAVQSSVSVLGAPFPATTEFFFLAGADPYFTNVVPYDPSNPTELNVPWLSEDLRVFTATPGAQPASQYQYPVPNGPQFVENSVGGSFDTNGAYSYIQALLKYLNQNYGNGNPGSTDPFAPGSNVIPQQQNEFTADSSVAPFSTIGGNTNNNYSFAVARVRLKGLKGSTSAVGVKVFFRLWGTQTADTAWDPSYTYLSQTDSSQNPLYPEAPSDDHTIPFFATSSQPNFSDPNDPEFQAGGSTGTGANNQTINIQQGDTQWAYFGCFLDVNDPNVTVNSTPIWKAFPGTHHCLVAQIAYSGTPIQVVNGIVPTPEGGSLLAQRNLQVTTSDNPGPASAHRVPQTFAVKPSGPPPKAGPLAGRPDELMIFWGNVPAGATAQIYWPGVSSAEVIKLASWMYGVHPLSAKGPHTIEVKTIKGVTFVPIPEGTEPVFAGLFTIELPQTVKTGQEFNVVVRRIGKRLRHAPPPPPPPPPAPHIAASGWSSGGHPRAAKPKVDAALEAVVVERLVYERYIVGSFQVKIPVSTSKAMLPAEETTLAIMKARLDGMPLSNPWHPVLVRYVGLIAGRVDGLGGNAHDIPPSLGGYRPPLPGKEHHEERRKEFTGKVCRINYDRFGDFAGFVLETEDGDRRFFAREPEIERVIKRAWAERILTSVVVEIDAPHRVELDGLHRPEEIVLHCPPKPLMD